MTTESWVKKNVTAKAIRGNTGFLGIAHNLMCYSIALEIRAKNNGGSITIGPRNTKSGHPETFVLNA